MRSLLLAVLAAYVVSAIHAVLAFLNKRRALQRVSEYAMAAGFVLHTAALIADWAIDGHYPLYYRRETLSFLAWTLVASYGLVLYRYLARPLGVVTMPIVALLVFIAVVLFFALLISYPWPVLTFGTVLYLASLPFGWLSHREYVRRDAEAKDAQAVKTTALRPGSAP